MKPNDIPARTYCGDCSFNREDADNTGYSCTLIDNILESHQDRISGEWNIIRDDMCLKNYPKGGTVNIEAKETA